MPTPPLKESDLLRTLAVVNQHDGNITQAAKSLGKSRSTVRDHLNKAASAGLKESRDDIGFPDLVDDEESVEEIVERATRRYLAKKKAHDSRENMTFKIKRPGPFVLAAVGDPHLDADGVNWPQLRDDMKLMAEHPHVHSCLLGDYINAWVGRLAAKYLPTQEVTQKKAWQLVEWFLVETKPFLCLLGNHDLWSQNMGISPFKWMQRQTPAPIETWSARFVLETSNGRQYRVEAAHDFPGYSIHNPAHHMMRRAKETGYRSDILICGHRHNWVIAEHENQFNGRHALFCMARGYKELDEYAMIKGYGQQIQGCSIGIVVDPANDFICAFPSIKQAADYVDALRRTG